MGRPHTLCYEDTAVSFPSSAYVLHCLTSTSKFVIGLIQRKPYLYLAELREQLASMRGVFVCDNTIRNILRANGHTYKKVCISNGRVKLGSQPTAL